MNYENLALIAGDDKATGSYSFTTGTPYENLFHETPLPVPINEEVSSEEVEILGGLQSSDTRNVPASSRSEKGKGKAAGKIEKLVPKSQRKKEKDGQWDNLLVNMTDMMTEMKKSKSEQVMLMKKKKDDQLLDMLGKAIYELDDFFELQVLEAAVNKLRQDDVEARMFSMRPLRHRKAWMETFRTTMFPGDGDDE